MIGDTLRREREKQKLSIKDVEQATSIRSIYINALEKGEYDKLPGEVYAKGFIKNYGNFLNLNGEELVRQFIMEISVASTANENTGDQKISNTEASIAAKDIGTKYRSKQDVNTSENFTSEDNSKKYIAAAVFAIAILIGGIFYSFGGEEISQAETQNLGQPKEIGMNVQPESPKVENVESVPNPEPQFQPVSTPTPQPVSGVNLQATFSGDCWTRVIVDGAMIYEGMINEGQVFDWNGAQNVSVLLGNAGAVQFVKNGQSIGALGGYGDVVEETFTAN